MIERKIIIGLITSTDYLRQIRNIWDPRYLESATAKRIAGWCWEYFEKYDKAPNRDIEAIYYAKLKKGKLPKDLFSEIEEDILPGLSEEYENDNFNLNYLLEETKKHFDERHLSIHKDTIDALLSNGQVEEANQLACDFKPIANAALTDLDLGNPVVLDRVEKAFQTTTQSLITYPRQLGQYWNSQLIRGGFVALMGPEKRGKTFWLLDMAIRGCRQKRNIAFFQAGDMTEDEQLMRICIYLTKKSNEEEYSGRMWEPVRDCIYNQIDDCKSPEDREGKISPFAGKDPIELKNTISLEMLTEAYKESKGYRPCTNCTQFWKKHWATVWIKKVNTGSPLTVYEAKKAVDEFFIKNGRHFKLSTHPNGTLSVRNIKSILANWEKQDDFVPDVILVDYADLLTGDSKDFRHLQNEIWKGLRSLSQEKGQPLVITATQADAKSYDQNRLKQSNFSEDKRKYGHVTAMWGLNQDTNDREKLIGLMRINDLTKRKGAFSVSNEITVLQNLKRGRPFLGSYW
jgi:hypothetical protein